MGLILPYMFSGGFSAKAQEVNANFNKVKEFVDNLENNLEAVQVDVADMQTNKADIRGSNSYNFRVADPVSSFDAVNLQYLEQYVEPIKGYISGFYPHTSGDSTFYLEPGICYDSNFIYPIKSTTNINGSALSLSTGHYYVWVVASTENSEVSSLAYTLISSGETPPISEGVVFRRVASMVVSTGHLITLIGRVD